MASKCVCPSCKLQFKLTDATAGKVRCPVCKSSFTVAAAHAGLPPAHIAKRGKKVHSSPSRAVMVMAGGLILFLLGGAALGAFIFSYVRTKPTSSEVVVAANHLDERTDPAITKELPNTSPHQTSLAKEDARTTPSPPLDKGPEPKENAQPAPIPHPLPEPKAEKPTEPKPKATPKPLTIQEARVQKAVDRGAAFLKTRLAVALQEGKSVRFHEGYIAFMGLTLLECGTPSEDATIQKAADLIRKSALVTPSSVYMLAPSLMFLDRLGEKPDHPLIRSIALRLVASQTLAGSWSYAVEEPLTPYDESKLVAFLKPISPQSLKGADIRVQGGDDLSPRLKAVAVVRWLGGSKLSPQGSGDNSNTHLALLALWVARRYDLPLAPAIIMAERYFRASQAADGGWGYTVGSPENHRASMTGVGLMALAMGRALQGSDVPDVKGKPRARMDPGIERAFRAFNQVLMELASRPRTTPKLLRAAPDRIEADPQVPPTRMLRADSAGDLYYLWALERMAMIYHVRRFGALDWYAWASEHILRHQNEDGSWYENLGPPADTCLALLVLLRVNMVQDLIVDEGDKEHLRKVFNIKGTDAEPAPKPKN